MSAFTPAGSGGIPVVANIPGNISPTVANVSMALAGTEYSYTLPGDTKEFYLKLRNGAVDLKIAFSAGTSGTSYISVPRGTWFGQADLDTSAVVTLYFQSPTAAQVLEILSWV